MTRPALNVSEANTRTCASSSASPERPGAPYAARVLDGLAAAGAEVGLCISQAGATVIAWELYRDRSLPADEATARFVAEHGGGVTTLYDELDWFSPYASGSAKCDAYVICPCSMATAARSRPPRRPT